MSIETTTARYAPYALSLLRIMSGALFLQHGTAKYLHFPMVQAVANVSPTTPSGIAGIVELVAGALLVLGLFTRPAAFIASGVMAGAYFMAHASRNFFPILNGGELAALYCFVFFYLAFAGGGPLSLDKIVRRR